METSTAIVLGLAGGGVVWWLLRKRPAPPATARAPAPATRPDTAVGFGVVTTAGQLYWAAGGNLAPGIMPGGLPVNPGSAALLLCANDTIGGTAPCKVIDAGLQSAYNFAESYIPGARATGQIVTKIGNTVTDPIGDAAASAWNTVKGWF